LYIRQPAGQLFNLLLISIHFICLGVGALRKVYGTNRRRGSRPNHFSKSSGAVIRKALQTLEGINWVEKHPDGGRRLSKQGRQDLDRLASQIVNNKE
jgi:small subunit ribosomal protein S19e